MSTRSGHHDDPLPIGGAGGKARAAVGFVIGVALFGAAVWVIVTGEQDFAESLDAARHAPWWIVASVLVLPVLNWLTVSESFRALTNRYADRDDPTLDEQGRGTPVTRREMGGLIASAWLLNYLPMKPGMFGRLAYHKHVNRIRYAQSARVIAVSVSTTIATLAILIAVAVVVSLGGPVWPEPRMHRRTQSAPC